MEDIYNLDETGCFWRALPVKGFGEKGKKCRGGKKLSRVTVVFLVNVAGGKEVPIVIWKSENPSCFQGAMKSGLPVKYYSHNNAWMKGKILDSVLTIFNRKMSIEGRSGVLFLDNAGHHPDDIKSQCKNDIQFGSSSYQTASPFFHTYQPTNFNLLAKTTDFA